MHGAGQDLQDALTQSSVCPKMEEKSWRASDREAIESKEFEEAFKR